MKQYISHSPQRNENHLDGAWTKCSFCVVDGSLGETDFTGTKLPNFHCYQVVLCSSDIILLNKVGRNRAPQMVPMT